MAVVNCESWGDCISGTIGSATNPARAVYCIGDWACKQATIYAEELVRCEGSGASGACEGATIFMDTPCLECVGANSGCGYNPVRSCTLNGDLCSTAQSTCSIAANPTEPSANPPTPRPVPPPTSRPVPIPTPRPVVNPTKEPPVGPIPIPGDSPIEGPPVPRTTPFPGPADPTVTAAPFRIPTENSKPQTGGGLSSLETFGIIVGIVVGISSIFGTIYKVAKWIRKKKEKERSSHKEESAAGAGTSKRTQHQLTASSAVEEEADEEEA